MFAKAIPLLALLVTTIRPLVAEPAAAHHCEVAVAGPAAQTSASICVPLELHPHGRSTVYLNQGLGSLGDIVGGRDGDARKLARLASLRRTATGRRWRSAPANCRNSGVRRGH